MMDGAAQLVTPVEENPVLTQIPKRQSRRKQGLDPSTEEECQNKQRIARELIKLTSKGGRGKRMDCSHSNWTYFSKPSVKKPQQLDFLPSTTSKKIKKNENERKVGCENDKEHDIDRTMHRNKNNPCTYQMMDLKIMQKTLSTRLRCKCNIDHTIKDFITYCSDKHDVPKEKMLRIANEWKSKSTSSNAKEGLFEVKENKRIGVTSMNTIICGECEEETNIEVTETKFKGKNFKGNFNNRPNSLWYKQNIEIVLATLACGIGATDSADFLSFLNFPNMVSFQRKLFFKIENVIGKYLRDVAHRSMQEMLAKEVEATSKGKGIIVDNIEDNKQNKIGLTVSYDMGWNKRSSGNRYDSMSGHCFYIGCRTKKIISSHVTSRKCKICDNAKKRGEAPTYHECPRNYEGSSKGMEAQNALHLLVKLVKDDKISSYCDDN